MKKVILFIIISAFAILALNFYANTEESDLRDRISVSNQK